MYASLPRAEKVPGQWYSRYQHTTTWQDASAQQRKAYIEMMGHEPPEPSCPEARAQYEYGYGRYRNKALKASLLAAASNQSNLVLR